MPEHVLMPDYDIITDGGRRRRWPAAEKLGSSKRHSRKAPASPSLLAAMILRLFHRTLRRLRFDLR